MMSFYHINYNVCATISLLDACFGVCLMPCSWVSEQQMIQCAQPASASKSLGYKGVGMAPHTDRALLPAASEQSMNIFKHSKHPKKGIWASLSCIYKQGIII